MVYQMIDVSI